MDKHKSISRLRQGTASSSPADRASTGLLQAYVEDFIQAKRRSWRPKTRQNYVSFLRRYVAHVGPDHWPPTRQGVLDWLDAAEAGGAGKTSINTYWTHVRTFLNFLEKTRVLSPDENPVNEIEALNLIPEPEELPPVAYPPEDLQKLFDYLNNLAETGDILAIRDRAILRFAYVTSAREGEIVSLRMEELDLEGGEAMILAQTSKGKKIHRVYFDRQLCYDLVAWLKVRPERPGHPQVFVALGGRKGRGSTIKPDALNQMLRRRCKKAKVFRRKFHALRHSSVLDALDQGISADKVQKQAGHANITTTLKYMRGQDEDRARAYWESSLSDSLKQRADKRLTRRKSRRIDSDGLVDYN